MIRVTINVVGLTAAAPYLDFASQDLANAYIAQVSSSNHWGKGAYEIEIGMNDDVTPYSSTRIESKYLVHNQDGTITETVIAALAPQGTLPADIIYEKKFGMIPAQVTFSTSDVTQEYNQKTLADYTNQRVASADAQVASLLSGLDKTTQLGDAMAAIYVYLNISGTQTADEIAAAKTTLTNNYSLYTQAKAIQAQMYSDIEAQKTSLGL